MHAKASNHVIHECPIAHGGCREIYYSLSGLSGCCRGCRLSGSCRVRVSECRARAQLATAPKALATAPKALATAPKALAPRICLEGACQRPKFSKGRLRRAFGQWGPSARLAISCATLAARRRKSRKISGIVTENTHYGEITIEPFFKPRI